MTPRLLVLGVAACATFAASAGAGTVPAATSSTTTAQSVQGESLHVPGSSGRVVGDRSAVGRRALALTGRRAARGRVRVRRRSDLEVIARAAGCSGTARLVVAVDGRRVISAAVTTRRTWSVLRATATVAAGARAISLRLTNPRHGVRCRRSLHVDRLAFVAPRGAAPTGPAPGSPSPASGTGPASAATPTTPAPSASSAPGGRWVPAPRTTWQWQLSGAIDQSVAADMYDIDLVDTPAATVAALQAKGRRAVFIAEYAVDPSTFCAQAAASGYSAIRKQLALDAWRQAC